MDKCKIINVSQVGIFDAISEYLNLYPNPVADQTTIVIPESINDLKGITLYNTLGEQINTNGLITNTSGTTLQLNTKALPAGTYTIKIANGSKMYVGQFVKL